MDSADTRNVCRYFLNGSCRFGSRCIYRHEMPVVPLSQICRYFQKGACWYGDHCNFLHVLQPVDDNRMAADRRGSVPSVVHSSMAGAPPHRRGSEPALMQNEVAARRVDNRTESVAAVSGSRDRTYLMANISEKQAQEADLDSTQSSEVRQVGASQGTEETSEEGASSAAGAAAPAPTYCVQSKADVAEAFLRSKKVTCGICMDKVYEKPDPRDQVFGILPNCNHSYCLQCIKTWRKTKDLGPDLVKTCPECRVSSAFYVPHKYWVEGQAKESLIVAFKEKFSKRRCSFYARFGCCPFKTDCLHRHDRPAAYRLSPYSTEEDDDDDVSEVVLDINLLGFFFAMTFLASDEEDEDFDFSSIFFEEENSF